VDKEPPVEILRPLIDAVLAVRPSALEARIRSASRAADSPGAPPAELPEGATSPVAGPAGAASTSTFESLLSLAKAFIQHSGIASATVADTLTVAVVRLVQNSDFALPGVEFAALARLCPEPALMGRRLLATVEASARAALALEPTHEVELLVMANHCYVSCGSADGADRVLRVAQERVLVRDAGAEVCEHVS
jgi:hypothetical protein